ncbi:DUF5590 domain-containing protein [Paenibacillus larvae]|uniref:cell wall elongation regulator TseB-like domain-containing protein n=1 Tax=Paenibacillus larvae TaxID=1464 RepID=UPI00227EEF81|nr:DUF5590 domain-containing protein [Paenibacillus larvae]MCY7476147.1 DUF5590 domain-containing protein [Paenibacillus larvae]MDE5165298.1 DUF5590 domain-containing protein [Paenibacillus larvae subsp. larvae]
MLMTIVFVVTRFYMNIQTEHWNEKTKAVEAAYAKTVLTKADKVTPFHGTSSYQIVYGQDKLGNPVIVWVGENGEVHTERADQNYMEQQVRNEVSKKHEGAEILRINAGKLKDEYVWEVFYSVKDNKTKRYYYDYYKFADGTFIDTYTLSLQ